MMAGNVIAATIPIMPKVIKTSASVKALLNLLYKNVNSTSFVGNSEQYIMIITLA